MTRESHTVGKNNCLFASFKVGNQVVSLDLFLCTRDEFLQIV